MAYAKRVDNNQKEIVNLFRELGFNVFITSMVGKGYPDITASLGGYNYFFEIKDGNKPPSQSKLTADEQYFHDTWLGQVDVICSTDDVFSWIDRNIVKCY